MLSKASILTKNFLLLPSENIHGSWKLIHGNNQQTPRDLQGKVAFSGITCQMQPGGQILQQLTHSSICTD